MAGLDILIPASPTPPLSMSGQPTWNGRILETPVAADQKIKVAIYTADNERHDHGPCSWMPKGLAFPAEGDNCLVVFDDDGTPWIAAFETTAAYDAPITALSAALDARLDALEALENVTGFAFTAGWQAFNTSYYYKDRDRVFLRGYVAKNNGTAPAAGQVIATLPVGYRPNFNTIHVVPSGNGANLFGVIVVNSSGQIIWQTGSALVNDLIGLDGISFRVGA